MGRVGEEERVVVVVEGGGGRIGKRKLPDKLAPSSLSLSLADADAVANATCLPIC